MEGKTGNTQADGDAFDLVHARILRFFPDLVAELGGNADALLRKVGISPSAGEPDATYRQLINLMELAATELACPDFGMRLACRQTGAGMFGPLGHVMQNSRTFGDALEYVATHTYAHSLAARVWLWRSPSGNAVFSGHDILLEGLPNRAQTMEQLLLSGHLAAMALTGGRTRVRQVHFRHQPVSSPRTYRRYFGCEVRFGQTEDGVVFTRADLDCPIAAPDAGAFAEVTAFIERHFTRRHPPLHAQVRGIVMQRLVTGSVSNELVAAALHMHPRTLHRHLRAEGTSFQQIKDEVRRDILLYYLQQTHLDLAAISEKLGFSEQSVTTRTCNRWFGMSPTRLRLRARESG